MAGGDEGVGYFLVRGRICYFTEQKENAVEGNGAVSTDHRSDTKFTPTEQRILKVLSDGMRHNREELRQAIDSQADWNTLKVHLHNIRGKLKERGQTIIFEAHRWGVYYRHVRLLCAPEDE